MIRCDEVGHLLKLIGENYVCERCKGWMPRSGGHWHEKAEETKRIPKTPLGKASRYSPSGPREYARPPRKKSIYPTPSPSFSPTASFDDSPKSKYHSGGVVRTEPRKESKPEVSDWPPYLRAYETYTDAQLKEAILELLDHKLYKSDKYTAMAEDIAGKSFSLSLKQRIALANHLKFHEKDF